MPAKITVAKSSLLLIHGAWHNQHCWDPLIPQLQKLHGPDKIDILTMNLPARGVSDRKNLKTFRHYVDSVIENCRKITIPYALLGHSMAGAVMTQAVCELAEMDSAALPTKVIYLSAYLPLPQESIFKLIDIYKEDNPYTRAPLPIITSIRISKDQRFCSIIPEAIDSLFYSLSDPFQRGQLPEQHFSSESIFALSGNCHYKEESFAKLNSHYLLCSEDRVIPLHQQEYMLERRPVKHTHQLNTDHSPFVCHPTFLAQKLHEILTS
jgi:pimeloyl-ACP methyl ester carboxylesterase